MVRKILFGVMVLVLGTGILSAQEIITTTANMIMAEGDGVVAINGNGTMTVSGKGMLFIVDRTGETEIEVESEKRYVHREQKTRGNNVHIYRRFDGTAIISGEDVAVIMQGINIQVSVSGTGMMLLEGIGEYTIDTTTLDWSNDGIMIGLGETVP